MVHASGGGFHLEMRLPGCLRAGEIDIELPLENHLQSALRLRIGNTALHTPHRRQPPYFPVAEQRSVLRQDPRHEAYRRPDLEIRARFDSRKPRGIDANDGHGNLVQ